MSEKYDVIIVGAGSMGMSTAYNLSKEGKKVLMIDAFNPPHIYGSHGGDTRIIRHAYGEGLQYIPLALRAQELWDKLEAETSERIFLKTGILTFGDPKSDFVNTAIQAGREFDELDVEEMNAQQINERWPGYEPREDTIAVYEPNAGVLFADNIIRTFRNYAVANGAELVVNEPVSEILPSEDGIHVVTNHNKYYGEKVLISAGAYNNKLLPKLGIDITLQPNRRAIAWFDSDDNLYRADNLPGFFADYEGEKYYGFPSIHGSGVKIGRFDSTGIDIDPEYIERRFGVYLEDEGDLRGFLRDYMPKANGYIREGKICLFTNSADEDFVVDFHPENDNIVIAGGFSGHGFKFSSVMGEILADLLTKGETEFDISSFKITRPEIQLDK